uniref:Nucleoporin autopeptidase n=1 Tax=Leersia perrieri TaxID=77586 RepID=A0A0D9XX78_9ORYZ
MFGSSNNPFGQPSTSPFGQTSSSPFGTQTGFGQASTTASNPFAPKPFGSPTTTFGAQTGSSPFGATSTGAFGQPSTPAFGATSTGAFGQPSTPAFGTTSTGAFGQPSTPAFGATSTGAFGQLSTPAFGVTSTGAFGQPSTPAFGVTSTGAFGQPSTPSPSPFGSSTPGSSLFGQKPSFGSFGSSPGQSSAFGGTFQQTQSAFGSSTFGAASFGSTTTPSFGATTTPAFGTTAPPFGSTGFGSSTTPGFGSSGVAFGASSSGTSTGAFSFGSSQSFGQTSSTFGSTPFGTTPSPFGAQPSPFGSQAAAPAFGNQAGGTRIQPYALTPDPDSATSGTQPAAKLVSISAMEAYKAKSHEELRLEDYQRGDKGGPNPSVTPATAPNFPSPLNPPNPTNPFSSTPPNNPFTSSNPSIGFGSAPSPSPFTSTTNSTLFSQTSSSLSANSTFPSPIASTTNSTLFSQPSSSLSANSTFPSSFGTAGINPNSFSTGSATNTQSTGLFSTSPGFAQQPLNTQPLSGFGSSTSALSTGNLFSTPTPGMTGGLFGSMPSPNSTTPTFQQFAPSQTSSMFSFQPPVQTARTGGFSGIPNTMNQAHIGEPTASQTNMVMQPRFVTNPFGTLPTMPQVDLGNGGSAPSVQYGISSLPVAEKPPMSRMPSSMVVPRHLSQRRIKLLPRKYNPTSDGKVPFFADDEESPATPKADAFFIPRENPRNLVIRPIDQWPSRGAVDRQQIPNNSADIDKGALAGSEFNNTAVSPTRSTAIESSIHCDDQTPNEPETLTRHGNGASIERLVPKLVHADYYTEPGLGELAAKERAEPGYCSRVRDFAVGRHGYGSIKFIGETDVRGLDLESIVEFNNREVIVYKDDSKKPPVGEGLNKPAVVTLLNIKCMNKKTSEQYTEGPRIDKYKEMLVKKAEEQGAEFISFDAAKGEWKFRVKHFSSNLSARRRRRRRRRCKSPPPFLPHAAQPSPDPNRPRQSTPRRRFHLPPRRGGEWEEEEWDREAAAAAGLVPKQATMFGSSNPFGQSSTSPFGQTSSNPFGAQTGFGQASTSTSNPFAPKPFGSPTTTFGAQTGSSPFGATSTGAFGQPSTPAFGSTSTGAFGQPSTPAFGATSAGTFGQPSTPAFGTPSSSPFGSSTPAFGASPAPAFGATSSTFGSGSLFGQKPSFGGFGSSPGQSSAFGGTFQQSQPAFGTSTFGASSTPAFGTTTTPSFGATTTPSFGTTTPAFGSTSTSLFGATSSPAFGTTGFGSSGTPAFGASSTPGFGASSSASFGTSTSAFSFGSSPSFGQTTSTFGSTPFGTSTSPFGTQTSPFGSQTAAPTFGQTSFGNQAGGTRIQPYSQTPDADSATSGAQPTAKLDSISAMEAYKSKSHEELRWEDYQRGDKGGPNPSGTPAVTPSFPSTLNNQFPQNTSNAFPSTSVNNPFAAKPSTGFGSTSTSLFNSPFNSTQAASSSPFASTTSSPLFTQTSSPLFANSTPGFASSSPFSTSLTNPSSFSTGLSLVNTQSAGLFSSSPAFAQQPFTQSSTGFGSSTPAFSTGSLFSTPTPGMTGGLFGSTPSFFSTPTFQQPAPAPTPNMFSFQPPAQTAPTGGFPGISNTMNQAPFGQPTPGQSNMVMQPALVTNPFGTLPAMPQMSIGNGGSAPSVQYGISSLPVAEKPLTSRTSLSMVVPRHLSQRRIKLLPRKYNPISDGKVPFFADDEESPATPKADAFFIPRENPRNLIIRPIDQWPSRATVDRKPIPKNSADADKQKGALAETVFNKNVISPTKPTSIENGIHRDDHASNESETMTMDGNGTSVERLVPKLVHADYYTEPSLGELAAKERAEPGYCSRVRDFAVGRHNYGSIKFIGETDVRGLDLESIVEFNYREVIVYKDDSKKPPVGEGLNKPAVVTLLNIKCMNKKTGDQYTEGPRVDKYKEILVKKAEEQGAEFISFDAAKGEWKFKVKHFSSYGFGEAEINSC